jgi:hypothetical protein
MTTRGVERVEEGGALSHFFHAPAHARKIQKLLHPPPPPPPSAVREPKLAGAVVPAAPHRGGAWACTPHVEAIQMTAPAHQKPTLPPGKSVTPSKAKVVPVAPVVHLPGGNGVPFVEQYTPARTGVLRRKVWRPGFATSAPRPRVAADRPQVGR